MIDYQIMLVGWLVVGLFFVSICNGLMFLVLLKNLHWLWVRKREDLKDQADYVIAKIRGEL